MKIRNWELCSYCISSFFVCDPLGFTKQLLRALVYVCLGEVGVPRRDTTTQPGCVHHTPKLLAIYLHILSRTMSYYIIITIGSTGVCVENFPKVAHNVWQR